MKQMITPEQMVSLSPIARKRLETYMEKKGWGMLTDEGFIMQSQLTIGQLIEFLIDHKVIFQITTNPNICDNLFNTVRDILEEKN